MKEQGSITVFSALCLMLTASFLFALLESARVCGLDAYAGMKAELGLESVCAEYQPQLWEDYHLLYLDGAYGKEAFSIENVTKTLMQRVNENFDTGWRDGILKSTDLFQMELVNVSPQMYQLATDYQGTAFLKHVSAYMKDNITYEMAEKICEKYRQGKELEESGGTEHSVEEANQAIRDAKEKQREEAAQREEQPIDRTISIDQSEKEEVQENPLEVVLELKRNAVLGMVVNDVATVSTSKTDLSGGLEERECQQGNSAGESQISWYEKILTLEYADQYFSDFTQSVENHAFSYELEYLICGKEEDKANLEGIVNRLLFLREAANVTHIIADREKINEALMIASTLAGFTGNPAIIKVVQIGIVAAWAYLESIQDVRALLQGDKIALIKNREQWTINIGNLLESFQTTSKAKNCSNGFSYQEYLKQFLFVMKASTLAYRMMDIMEQNIKMVTGNENFKMNHMIGKLLYQFEYESSPLFSRLSVIGRLKANRLIFTKESKFTYF